MYDVVCTLHHSSSRAKRYRYNAHGRALQRRYMAEKVKLNWSDYYDVKGTIERLMKEAADRTTPLSVEERLAKWNRAIDICTFQAEIIAETRDLGGFAAAAGCVEKALNVIAAILRNESEMADDGYDKGDNVIRLELSVPALEGFELKK